MTLDVLIVTHTPSGILRVDNMHLPRVDGIRYIVSWQAHEDAPVPPTLLREDMTILRYDGTGVSNNRNNALSHSSADIALIADDDLSYTAGGLTGVIETFRLHPEIDLASFMYEGADCKSYPSEECQLTGNLPKGFFQTTFELAIRRNENTSSLSFDPDFGPGGRYFSVGEDEIFSLEARRRGLDVRFFPVVITRHEGLTTGLRRMTDPRALAGTGAVIYFSYPLTAILRIPLKAWRMARAGQASFIPALWHGIRGALTAAFLITPPWKRK